MLLYCTVVEHTLHTNKYKNIFQLYTNVHIEYISCTVRCRHTYSTQLHTFLEHMVLSLCNSNHMHGYLHIHLRTLLAMSMNCLPHCYTIPAIKQQKNDEHLRVIPEVLPNILQDLFSLRVWKMWKIFGKHFGVNDKELSEIKSQKREPDPFGGCEEFRELIVILMNNEDRFTFSKENIYEALKKCHVESAEEFKREFY